MNATRTSHALAIRGGARCPGTLGSVTSHPSLSSFLSQRPATEPTDLGSLLGSV